MAVPESLERLSAAAVGRLLLGGTTDAVEVMEFFYERIERTRANPVFISLTAERARTEAEASVKRLRDGRPLGPLDGVPIAWKDLFDLAGSRTTVGSDLFRDVAPATEDAPCVAQLAAAGMVALGKVNLTEFAFSGIGINPHFGTPANPHDPETPRIPGGSSSGSGVAVAAGLAPCAIGSDTGGSVRIPAALNGVVGFKTSERRIDARGAFPLSPTLDTVGPLARSVEDCVLLDLALRGLAAGGARRAELSGLRLLVPETVMLDDLDEAVGANFEAALRALSAAGAAVERRPLPLLQEVMDLMARHKSYVSAEAYEVHQARVDGPEVGRIDPRVVDRILIGKEMSAFDVLRLQAGRARLAGALADALDGALLATPTVAHTAPEIAPLDADRELFHRVNLKTLRNTMIGNFLGVCGLSLPSGADARGLPTGILFSAPGGHDERLLSFGLAIERALLA